MVGRHAMEGTPNACLPHGKKTINGRALGEIRFGAAIVGHFDIPLVFLSGDKACIDELHQYISGFEYIITKWEFAPYSVKTRSVAKSEN